MSRKKMLVIYVIAFAVFCGSLLWKYYENKKTKEFKIVYTTKESIETTSVSEFVVSTSEKIKETVTKTTHTDLVFATTTVPQPLYIDINSADAETLCRLNGIGKKLAEDIISYRNEHGSFRNIEEIMNVYGIGSGIFNNICDNIYVENPIYPDENSKDEQHDNDSVDGEPPPASELTLDDVSPINLNEADVELLMYLPYVDETIAERIIALRESIHGFSHPYELLYVEGLTQEQIAEIIDYVYVEGVEIT